MTPIDKVIIDKNTKINPIWIMRQAGRYLPEFREIRSKNADFIKLCLNENLSTEITLQPLKRFDLDAAIIFSDILMLVESFNLKVRFVEGKGPLIKSIKDIKDFSTFKELLNYKNLDIVYESIKHVKKETIKEKIPLIGFAGAPWTLATYMIEGALTKDHNTIKTFAIKESVKMSILIELLIKSVSYHLINQIKAGVDVVQIFDSHAGKGDDYIQRIFCIDPVKRIVDNVKKYSPSTPIIVFSKGINANIFYLTKIPGVNCISVDNNTNLNLIKNTIPNNICIQGNLDPVRLVVGSEQMLLETRYIKKIMKNKPFIFNLGHGILPNTPIENVQELINEIRKK